MKKYSGKIIDPLSREMFSGSINVENGVIKKINRESCDEDNYILPGFVDAHIHIESSMLTPQNFSRIAVKYGTVAVISDPHEIANVLGVKGVEYMIKNASKASLKFFFGAPSCVPATQFEKSGAIIGPEEIEKLLRRKDVYFLSEMMNYPGVIYEDEEIIEKLNLAKKYKKNIDGHAPGLNGENLKLYVKHNISTDHECFSYEEAIEKIEMGMNIQIREGSAAKNFEALYPLISEYNDRVMLCSDDLHPDDLIKGHINLLLKKALEKGIDFFDALQVVSVNPVKHYKVDVGLVQEGDRADFIIVKDLNDFEIEKTIINGNVVYDCNKELGEEKLQDRINVFVQNDSHKDNYKVPAEKSIIKVIEIIDGELITRKAIHEVKIENGFIEPDLGKDLLKIVVQNRYVKEKPAIGFIKGFKLKRGGLVSTIAHDSHNIICVGTNDNNISELISWVNKNEGGIAVHDGDNIIGLELGIAGIISDKAIEEVAEKYSELDKIVKAMGSELMAPFMTLSFMALLVIPELKIGNAGLFDVEKFSYTSLFEE